MPCLSSCFFNDTATTEIYTLSLHDALPISDKAFAAKAAHLEGVVRDNVHLLNQVQLGYTIPDLRIDVVELISEKLFGSLLFGQKIRVWRDHSHTDNVLVDRNEPGPVKLSRVEDQRIVFRFFAGSAGATDRSRNL